MAEEKLDFNIYFFNLVTMFSSAAWQQLGKTASPVDGKIKRDLNGAKVTIDMLVMIRDKMKGNLTKKEEEILGSTIANLQMNYADEAAKPIDAQNENTASVEDKEHKDDCGCGCH
ncbi:MAG: DUF1844 domain-containing protein [Endomicrobium sp.]|jgi:cobalamin biosynthesis protein CobD/CbiB|nr:DUF1844 domain-containing protein [Endomicrobium sp.]